MDWIERAAWGLIGGIAGACAAIGFDTWKGVFEACLRFVVGALVCYTATGPVTKWSGLEPEAGNHGFVALILGLGSWGLAGWVWRVSNKPELLLKYLPRNWLVRTGNGSGKHDVHGT